MAMADVLSERGGRPRAPWQSSFDMVSFNYLVRISKKYEIGTPKLLKCIRDAWIQGESSFDDIIIRRRQMIGDDGIFLVTQNERIITQLRITSRLLEYLRKIDAHSLRT
jgi:hypothetical protein